MTSQRAYTRDEAVDYRRVWGGWPPGYTEQSGRNEERRREVLAHGARHATCGPTAPGADWLCRAAERERQAGETVGSDCGTIREAV